MDRLRRLKPILGIIALLALWSCGNNNQFQGYIEGDFTYISPQVGGTLYQSFVSRGQQVQKGQLLFDLNPEPEQDEVKAAQATLNQARSQLADLEKGERPTKLKALEAQVKQAQAQLDFATRELQRYQKLAPKKYVSANRLNELESNYNVAVNRLQEATQNLNYAKLAARSDLIRAAESAVHNALYRLKQAEWRLSEKKQYAPFDALVYDIFYYPGETVTPNNPVLSLLRPKDVYAVFYVGYKTRATLKTEQPVYLNCNGCPKPIPAKISFISPRAVYAPPVIYSQQTNKDLVYQIRAKPDQPIQLYPGQPVTVSTEAANSD